ncbi:GL14404 [Drosophila persimilis]|uniref:GL14404 n=1 Tax=Drosophila persimilis TaxID=7234 RepID=B4GTR4_DROPE|nr:GL14404 [Drosophila persimilis]
MPFQPFCIPQELFSHRWLIEGQSAGRDRSDLNLNNSVDGIGIPPRFGGYWTLKLNHQNEPLGSGSQKTGSSGSFNRIYNKLGKKQTANVAREVGGISTKQKYISCSAPVYRENRQIYEDASSLPEPLGPSHPAWLPPELSESYTSNSSFLTSSSSSKNYMSKLARRLGLAYSPEGPSKEYTEYSTGTSTEESAEESGMWNVQQKKAFLPKYTDFSGKYFEGDDSSSKDAEKESSEDTAESIADNEPSDDEGEDERFYRQMYELCRAAHLLMCTYVLKKAKEMSQRRKAQL